MIRLATLALTAALIASAPARANNDALNEPVTGLAQEVWKLMQQQKQDSVAVGEFTGPAKLSSNAGPAIQRALIQALEKLGAKISPKAALEVKGHYAKVKNPQNDFDEVKLTVTVLDGATADVVSVLPGRFVYGNDALVRLLGGGGKLPNVYNERERNKHASQAVDKPSFALAGSHVKSTADSLYSFEVLVKQQRNGQWASLARKPEEKDGLAFVGLDENETYSVRVTNNSNAEMAVGLCIDGLDLFTFAEEKNPKTGMPYRHYIVAPKSSVTIPGWFKNSKTAFEFTTAKYGEGEASKLLGSAAKVGTITVTFAPVVERQNLTLGSAMPPGGLETKKGREFRSETAAVEREVGPLIDVVTVRYDRPGSR